MTLLSACLIAIVAVFFLLGLLAVLMKLITAVFPVLEEKTDPALIAAITTTVATLFPGARVTRIEEER